MKSFSESRLEEARLKILRLLAETKPDYKASASMLRQGLREIAYQMDRGQMSDELAWLAERRLVVTEVVGPEIFVSLTADGLDVAEGKKVSGIKQHSRLD